MGNGSKVMSALGGALGKQVQERGSTECSRDQSSPSESVPRAEEASSE